MSAANLVVEMLRTFGRPAAPEAGVATAPPEPIGAAGALPEATADPGTDLLTVLRNRRAIRVYATAPTAAADLRAVIADGLAADRRHWPAEAGCCPLVPVVVAQNVDVLAPAAYRFDGGDAWPVMDLGTDYETFTLQREFAAAGAIVSILGDLAHADRAHGGDGYRRLMTRAGAAAYRMWLSGIGLGLAGSVFAGFLPGAVRAPLRCDGVSRHQLFALALGGAVTEEGGETHGKP